MNQSFIRNAAVQDIEEIYSVEQSAFPPKRQASYETLLKRIKLFPEGCLVCLKSNKIIAFSTALIIDRTNAITKLDLSDQELHNINGDTYELRSIAVMKGYQKQGIGKELVKKQIENAKSLNKKYMQFTAAKDVEVFYEKLGFKKITDYEEFHNSKQAIWELELS